MMRIIDKFFEVPRIIKRCITLLFDVLIILTALFFALLIRVGDDWEQWFQISLVYVSFTLVFGSVAIWIKLGLYRAVIRYLDVEVLTKILWGSFASVILLIALLFIFEANLPRSVPFIYASLVLILVAGSRLLIRGLIIARNGASRVNVAIYGAGSAGRQLCLSLVSGVEYRPTFFIDEDKQLVGTKFSDVMVYPPNKIAELVEKFKIQKVLVAIPSASVSQRKVIYNRFKSHPVEIMTIPGSADLVSGKVSVSQLRTIQIQDLLGRDEVPPHKLLLDKCIKKKNILITGGGGSIGSELCRQIAALSPQSITILELSEYNLYQIEKELRKEYPSIKFNPVLGNVQNEALVDNTISLFEIDTIYHAAACKHVPLVEQNIKNGLENNIWGTKVVVEAAHRRGVGHFVLISTDKAVRPTNIMGASKRFAELVTKNFANKNSQTVFCMVRFGNVLGSSGSVIPLFRQQIENGGPVTVTHPEITRYFMTIPEAASLVIQAGAMADGGEVFVLDMGQPVKIVDLAKSMISLMGLTLKDKQNEEGDIEIVYSGLRPGEKLFEELLIGDNVEKTQHPLIMKAQEKQPSNKALLKMLNDIEELLISGDMTQLQDLLIHAEIGYNPVSEIVDLFYQNRKSNEGSTSNITKLQKL